MSDNVKWIAADWPAPEGIVAGTTTRVGGTSGGVYATLNLGAHVDDKPEDVARNRRRLVAACGLPTEPVWLDQVHGNHVVVDPGKAVTADAIVVRRPGTVCAVMTADCLPVLFVSSSGSEVAAAHAGWRGLRAGVLERTVREFGCGPGEILAWLGPAISQAHFEVGDEVREAFVAQDVAADVCFERNDLGRWQADLYGLARQQLKRAGVGGIFGGQYCTFADAGRFYSYRRDGQCGRMASFVFRNRESR